MKLLDELVDKLDNETQELKRLGSETNQRIEALKNAVIQVNIFRFDSLQFGEMFIFRHRIYWINRNKISMLHVNIFFNYKQLNKLSIPVFEIPSKSLLLKPNET